MINAILFFLAKVFPSLGAFILFKLAAWHVLVGAAVVAGVVVFLDKVFLVLGYFGAVLLSWVVKLLVAVLIYVVSRLPDMPADAPAVAWSQLASAFAAADRYLPMNTVMMYLGMLFTIYSGVMVYKFVKFIRGGG